MTVKTYRYGLAGICLAQRRPTRSDGGRARLRDTTTMKGKKVSAEACALERVGSAAREVQAASLRLEAHYAEDPNELPSTLELARFAAAMQELKNAREAFDTLVEKRDRTSP
jgi:hypothetical protein